MRALLLGDSIRIGYLPFVRDALADLVDVVGPEDNCEDSANVLANLDRWLGAGAWRVIHFNCGLHDIKIDRWTGICKTPFDRYRDNLCGVCARLRKTGVELIWATTTPVIYERHVMKGFDRREQDVLAYNQVALEVIREHGIQVNDLHDVAQDAGVERILSHDGVHFTEAGSRLLAGAVAGAIRTQVTRKLGRAMFPGDNKEKEVCSP